MNRSLPLSILLSKRTLLIKFFGKPVNSRQYISYTFSLMVLLGIIFHFKVVNFMSTLLNIFTVKAKDICVFICDNYTLCAVILYPIIFTITQIMIYNFILKGNRNESVASELAVTLHDLKNSLFCIAGYAEIGNTNKVKEKVYELCSSLNTDYFKVNNCITSENVLNISLNSLIEQKKSVADSFFIKFSRSVDNIQCNKITSDDLCVLLGNILDNAIEACGKIKKYSDRFINLEVEQVDNKLKIILKNSINPSVNMDMNTTKPDKTMHGHGLKSVNKIVNKYNGKIKNTIEDNTFVVQITLPIV